MILTGKKIGTEIDIKDFDNIATERVNKLNIKIEKFFKDVNKPIDHFAFKIFKKEYDDYIDVILCKKNDFLKSRLNSLNQKTEERCFIFRVDFKEEDKDRKTTGNRRDKEDTRLCR